MKQRIFDVFPGAERITSRTNPLVVALAKLSSSKHRREQGLFLAEGVKLLEEAVELPEVRHILLESEDGLAEEAILSILKKVRGGVRILVLAPSVFEKISTEGAPQGVITVLEPISRLHGASANNTDSAPGRILALDAIQDPGNLGTMVRTASAFGYSRILLGNCADVYHPRTVRASMGALFRMPIEVCDSLPERLAQVRESGRRVISAALRTDSLELGRDVLLSNDCIVIGNEGHGVSPEILALSDGVVRIPMMPGTESLNAAGAAAVLMWEYFRTFH